MHVLDEFQRFLRFDRQGACVAARAVWLYLGIRSLCRAICGLVDQRILRFHNFDLAEILFGQCERQQLPAKRRVAHDQREDKVVGEGQKIRVWFQIDRRDGVVIIFFLHQSSFPNIGQQESSRYSVSQQKQPACILHKVVSVGRGMCG